MSRDASLEEHFRPVGKASRQESFRGLLSGHDLPDDLFRAERAQDAQPDTYAGFEGKNVSRIEISAGPTSNTDAFRSLIKQKGNAPFSGVGHSRIGGGIATN